MEKVALGAWAEGGKEKTPHEKFKHKIADFENQENYKKIYVHTPDLVQRERDKKEEQFVGRR